MQVTAFIWVFLKSKSMGSMWACTSSMLNVVSLRAPVMKCVALPWIEQSSFMTETEPSKFILWVSLKGGTYQTSEVYVKAGTATVLQSWCALPGGILPVTLANLWSCCVHMATLAITSLQVTPFDHLLDGTEPSDGSI